MSSFRQTATGALRRITTTAHELHVRKSNHDDPQCPKQSSQKLSRDNSNGIGNSSGSGSDSSSVRQRQASFSAEVPDAKLEAKVVTSSLNEDGGGTDGVQTHNTGPRFSSATSAAITRLKGTIRAGSKKRSLKPRSLTLDAGLPFLRGGKRGGNAGEAPPYAHQDDSLPRGRKIARNSCEMSPRRENAGGAGHDVTSLANDGKTTDEKRTKLSVIFDDDEGTNDAVAEDGRIATSDDLEYATDPRSKWTSTLMASTLARGRAAGKQNVSDRVGLFPHPRDAGNRVGGNNYSLYVRSNDSRHLQSCALLCMRLGQFAVHGSHKGTYRQNTSRWWYTTKYHNMGLSFASSTDVDVAHRSHSISKCSIHRASKRKD